MCVGAPTLLAQTIEEIVAGNVEAKGGEEAWLAVKTAKMSGTMRMGGGAAGAIEVPFSVEYKRPMSVRVEFSMQGMTAIQAFDGESGWSVMPFLGKPDPEQLAEDQVKQLESQAELEGVLVNYEEKGHKVELLGSEDVDGTPAYKVQVVRANGDEEILYLDKEYLIEFKTVSKRSVQGNQVEVTMILGDYKEVDGLLIAHSMEIAYDGVARQTVTIDKVELGLDIPDQRFEMPTVEEPAEMDG